MFDKKPNKLNTMYLSKDMRVPKPNFLKTFDEMEWGNCADKFELIEEQPAMGRKRYRFKKK